MRGWASASECRLGLLPVLQGTMRFISSFSLPFSSCFLCLHCWSWCNMLCVLCLLVYPPREHFYFPVCVYIRWKTLVTLCSSFLFHFSLFLSSLLLCHAMQLARPTCSPACGIGQVCVTNSSLPSTNRTGSFLFLSRLVVLCLYCGLWAFFQLLLSFLDVLSLALFSPCVCSLFPFPSPGPLADVTVCLPTRLTRPFDLIPKSTVTDAVLEISDALVIPPTPSLSLNFASPPCASRRRFASQSPLFLLHPSTRYTLVFFWL